MDKITLHCFLYCLFSFCLFVCWFLSDSQPPKVNCSTDITADNDPGTKMAIVTWDFNFTDNSLLEDEPGITKDSFTIVLTIGGNNVDTNLPKLFEIGEEKSVQYTITDPAGNSGTCQFTVKVLG